VSEVLARRDRALSPEETEGLLRDRLGDHVQRAQVAFGVFTVWVATEAWADAVARCRDESLLAYDLFDCLFGIDAGQDGFDVVVILYSTTTGNRITLRTRCDGGREAPTCPSITELYRGANWMEREAYDMFGIEFSGHPGLEPRILTVENFEGWPLRKDFHLASRVAKPWPGVAEPKELDEDGNVIERESRIGDAPGPYDLDKAMAEQARRVNEPAQLPVADAAEDSEAPEAPEDIIAPEDGAGQASPDVEATADEPAETTDDAAADAKAKAEARRREQAEARARKAAERADEDQEAGDDGEKEQDA